MSVRLSTNMIKKAWSSKLQSESTTRDIMVQLSGSYADETKQMPEAVIFNVQKEVEAGVNSVQVGLMLDLVGSGVEGDEFLLGNEETQVIKEIELFSNEVSNGVTGEKYGIHAWRKSAYSILQKIQPQLSKWHDLKRGEYIRQAICEIYPTNLAASPVSKTQAINSNIWFAGLAAGSQPAYDSTLATYQGNLVTAAAIVTGTPTAANQMSVTLLNRIITLATSEKEIEPIAMNGRDMYVLTVDSEQAELLRNPGDSSQLANLYKDADVRGPNNKAIKGLLGTFGSLVLMEDTRAPRVNIAAGPTVSFTYRGNGPDTRDAAATDVFAVNMLLGKAAVGSWQMEALHFEDEMQNHGKTVSIGAFANYGYQAMEFDAATPTDTSRYNKSSILVLTITALA